ncbi:MAG: hypothetical protein U1E26_00585 [Coriobacteriia bacterium]|nr:hypothetical protein [Coriobacteriia bacterium]
MRRDSRVPAWLPWTLVAAGLIGALLCAANFPAVQGLGTKVRLPVFHGAMTWVNLGAFSSVALLALVYLFTRREGAYRWEEALRWIAIPMWLVGSILGLNAALSTWDFTGSKASPLTVAAADPRLLAQFWILVAAFAVIALALVFEDRRVLAGIDLGFVTFMWVVILRAVLGPGRALHPDSPVMNSDEIIIKAMFFGIVISLAIATLAGAWVIARARAGRLQGGADG